MKLKHIERFVHDYILKIQELPAILEKLEKYKYSLDALEKEILMANWGLTICSYCSNAQILFDIVFPSDSKAEWTLALRLTIRCAKTAEKFVLEHTVLDGKNFSIPGLYTYRSPPCPLFEKFSGPEGRK